MTETTPHSPPAKAILFAVSAAVLWSTGGVLIKLVDWNPIAIAGSRSGIAVLVMLAAFGRPRLTWTREQVMTAIAYVFMVVLFVVANKTTTAANAILLQFTAPVWVALFSPWYLGEQPSRRDWLLLLMMLAGMTLFFMDSLDGGAMLGNGCGILSGVAMAWMVLGLRKQKDARPIDSVILGNALTFLLCLPAAYGPMIDLRSVVGLICLGVFQLGLSYILYSQAIRHLRALDAMLIPILEPLCNPIWVMLVVGERPGPWALIGGGVILSAVLFHSALGMRRRGHIARGPMGRGRKSRAS
ncbi:MAG: DMT family transporter [Bdellovibrionales bacterium]|nr:DMT family transporter [Bdellovibrionales bacterium]